jgi:hypothetical protein
MGNSPFRSSLYRRAAGYVILLAIVCGATLLAQTPYGSKPYKGPRALGLIELPAKGKPHFIPIAILVNGAFYDASVYKADPVPMALWPETVYEGLKTGVSQGLFTVTTASQTPKTQEWIAEGNWQSTEELAKLAQKASKKPGSSIPRGMEDEEGPPVLRHSGAKKPTTPAPTQTSPDASKPSTPAAAAPPPSSTTTQQNPVPATASAAPSADDPNVPVLRRGKPTPKPAEPEPQAATTTASKSAAKPAAASAAPKAPAVQLIAAISDSSGPDLRPYSYNMDATQEEQFRKKMLAMAADEVTARAKKLAVEMGPSETAHSSKGRLPKSAKPAQPDFRNVELHVFDLSSSNEPVLVLTADAQVPKTAGAPESGLADLDYSIALVAREDINGDYHKAFAEVTDTAHLDVLPRYELIDAVDADGDGRGELLFRQISDDGSTFGIYRVIGNQLYPLFQSAP